MRTNLSEDGGGVCVMHFILPSTVCFCVGVGRKGGRERFTRQCPQQASKFKLYKFLVNSILFYGCETWTLLANSEKRIQAFETKCLRKLLRISYLDRKTNDWVRNKINSLMGPREPLLATVKRWKLAWFRHVTRHDSLSKTISQGTLEGG